MSVYLLRRLVIPNYLLIMCAISLFGIFLLQQHLIFNCLGNFEEHHLSFLGCYMLLYSWLLDSWYAGPWVSILFWRWGWRWCQRLVCAVVNTYWAWGGGSLLVSKSQLFMQIVSCKMVWTNRTMICIWISKNKRKSWRSCWIRLNILCPTDLNLLI